jgi:hypothetical protein
MMGGMGMQGGGYDREQLQTCLNTYLQDRLDSFHQAQAEDRAAGGRTAEEERSMAMDRYQHRIWQLKDRLSCQVYGPHTESLVDGFISRFGISVSKPSQEYLWILRKVLQTEIRLYTILMHRLSSENGEQFLFQRKVPGKGPEEA